MLLSRRPGIISGVTGDPAGSSSAPSWHYHPRFPKHWQRRSLLSLAHWVNGLAFRNIQFSPAAAGGKPVIKIAEIKGGISAQTRFTTQTFDDAVRVRAGDLLFSWSGQPETSIDAYRWRGPEGWLNQHVFRVTPVDVDTAFFHYLLRYLNPHFVAIAKNKQTTGLGHVTRRDLETMRVAVPPLSEQRAIGHVLGSLDDKIDLNRRMNETLEAMVRALFTSWFVDFEPVRAKMAGRDTGMQEPIYDLFPERIVGIGNRQVPEGWRRGTVHDVASLNPESWSAKRRPTELSYVDLANTKWGYLENVATMPWEEAPSRARRVLRKRDTIMATVRPGNGAFALVDEDGLTGSTGFAVLRPREAADRALVWCAVTSAANLARLSLLADGSAYPAVRPAVVAATPVALADFAIRASFSSLVDPLLDKIEASKRESRHLRGLRDQLLPRFFTGKL